MPECIAYILRTRKLFIMLRQIPKRMTVDCAGKTRFYFSHLDNFSSHFHKHFTQISFHFVYITFVVLPIFIFIYWRRKQYWHPELLCELWFTHTFFLLNNFSFFLFSFYRMSPTKFWCTLALLLGMTLALLSVAESSPMPR